MEKYSFSERVTHYQNKYRMDDEDLAYRLGVSVRTVQRYKREPEIISVGTLKKMSTLFKCRPGYLIDGHDYDAENEAAIKLIKKALSTE